MNTSWNLNSESSPPFNISTLPLISVVIPAFNHEKYVERCLQSLIEDGYPNLEVLLMDDGSTDSTYTLAKKWADEFGDSFVRIYIGTQRNRGVASTLNKLISISSGEYITLLASDDYLLHGGLLARFSILQNHPEWLAVIGDCIVVDGNGEQIFSSGISEYRHGNKKYLLDATSIRRELLLKWSIPGPVLLLRKSAFDAKLGVGMYDESLIVEDKDFYLRLLARNSLGFVDENVSAYRVHEFSVSKKSNSGTRSVRLMRDLGKSCEKNINLFGGYAKLILRVQSFAYEAKARQLESGRILAFVYKVSTSVLWRILNMIYVGMNVFCK